MKNERITVPTNHVQKLVVVLKEVIAAAFAAFAVALPQVRQQGAGRLLDLRLREAVQGGGAVGVCRGDGHFCDRPAAKEKGKGEREGERKEMRVLSLIFSFVRFFFIEIQFFSQCFFPPSF